MTMKSIVSVMLLALATFAVEAVPYHIAVLHGKHYMLEKQKLEEHPNFACQGFYEEDLPKLAENLKKFDMVFAGKTFGENVKPDWDAIAEPFRNYVSDGGILLITDFNYPMKSIPVLLLDKTSCPWYGACEVHKDIQRVTHRTADEKLGISMFPNRLQELFVTLPVWQHLQRTVGWTSVVNCHENAPIIVFRNYGKGLVVLSAYCNFGQSYMKELTALLENIIAYQKLRALNLEAISMEMGHSPGENTLAVAMKLLDNGEWSFDAKVMQEGKTAAEKSQVVSGIPGKELSFAMPYTLAVDKEATLVFTVSRGGQKYEFTRRFSPDRPLRANLWREEVYPLIAATWPLAVNLAPAFASGHTLRFELDGVEVKGRMHRAGLYHLDLSKAKPGKHTVTAILKDKYGKEVYRSQNVCKVLERNPRSAIGIDNILRIDGKKVFPLGYSCQTWQTPGNPRLDAVEFIHKAGGNFISTQMDSANDMDFIKLAEKYGIYVCGAWDRYASSYCKEPAVVTWSIYCEPELKNEGPLKLLEMQRKMRAINPDWVTMGNFLDPATFSMDFLKTADWVGHDPYPLPKGEITTVYYSIRKLVDSVEGTSHMPFVYPQAFGFKDHPFFQLPRPEEIRNMTYQAVVAGVQGILFFTYRSSRGTFTIEEHPDFCAEMLRLTKELRDITPFFLSGTGRNIETGVRNVFARSWENDGKILTITVNGNRHDVPAHNLKALEVRVEIR